MIFLGFCCHFSDAQVRVFNKDAEELIEAKDSVMEIEEKSASDQFYDFLSDGSDDLNVLFLSKTKSIAGYRPDELQKSQTLMSLASLATTAWKGTQYADAKKWRALSKHFQRAFNRSTSKFNYTKEISFRIRLVNNNGKKFYCDKNAEISVLNLYSGKKPTGLTKEEKEEQSDPIPLEYFSEQELMDQFVKELNKQKILRDLKSGRYACVGVNVEIDERTLNRNRIPTARVVIVFGARRLRDLRIKEVSKEETPKLVE
jgi:hypothetical protein